MSRIVIAGTRLFEIEVGLTNIPLWAWIHCFFFLFCFLFNAASTINLGSVRRWADVAVEVVTLCAHYNTSPNAVSLTHMTIRCHLAFKYRLTLMESIPFNAIYLPVHFNDRFSWHCRDIFLFKAFKWLNLLATADSSHGAHLKAENSSINQNSYYGIIISFSYHLSDVFELILGGF